MKTFKILGLLLLLDVAVCSCSKENFEEGNTNPDIGRVDFSQVSVATAQRLLVGKWEYKWTDGGVAGGQVGTPGTYEEISLEEYKTWNFDTSFRSAIKRWEITEDGCCLHLESGGKAYYSYLSHDTLTTPLVLKDDPIRYDFPSATIYVKVKDRDDFEGGNTDPNVGIVDFSEVPVEVAQKLLVGKWEVKLEGSKGFRVDPFPDRYIEAEPGDYREISLNGYKKLHYDEIVAQTSIKKWARTSEGCYFVFDNDPSSLPRGLPSTCAATLSHDTLSMTCFGGNCYLTYVLVKSKDE